MINTIINKMNLAQLKAVQSRLEKFLDVVDFELTNYEEDDFRKLNYEDDRQSFRKYLNDQNSKLDRIIENSFPVIYLGGWAIVVLLIIFS